jgi:hypothetical protein
VDEPSEPFPWLYPFVGDGPRRGSLLLRPIVPVTLIGAETSTRAFGLVDTGAEHTLAAPWLANDVGISADDAHDELDLGIGGAVVRVRFVHLRLRLHRHASEDDDDIIEWESEIGLVDRWIATFPVLLGQRGFLDRFAVTMSRQAQRTAIESWSTFDERFGIGYVA